MAIVIKKLAKVKLNKPTIILGLPGVGLVGSVAASYLIESMGLKLYGYIKSPDFAPLASIHDYKPYPPARIHYSKKYNLLVILSEMSIPISCSQELADKIYSFAMSLNAKELITLGGITMKEKPHMLYLISSNVKYSEKFIKNKRFKPIKEGATTGVGGLLLTQGALEDFPVTLMLSEASADYLDPGAASLLLHALSEELNVKIDTKKLDKEAKMLAEQMKGAIIKSKLSYKRSKELGSMYG